MTSGDWHEAAEERAAIMEHDGGLSREVADTYSREWLMECLARELLTWTLAERREFIDQWSRRHGAVSTDRLKAALTAEWEARR